MTPIEIRPEQSADRAAVRRVVEEAFEGDGHVVADLVDALNAARRTQVSLVAEIGGVLAGHVQLSRSWIDARERLVEVLVLSPLSVLPERQRAGVGTALVAAALEWAAAEGCPAVFVEGSPDYYAARGFSPGSEHGFVRPSVRIPEPAFQVALLESHEPWMSGALVYCDPFWALDCVGLRDPE